MAHTRASLIICIAAACQSKKIPYRHSYTSFPPSSNLLKMKLHAGYLNAFVAFFLVIIVDVSAR